MKDNQTIINPHTQPRPKTEGDANLLGFFALLFAVNLRNKREKTDSDANKKKKFEIEEK